MLNPNERAERAVRRGTQVDPTSDAALQHIQSLGLQMRKGAVKEVKAEDANDGKERVILEGTDCTYECVGRTGKGSFGVVFLAQNMSTHQEVAIKRVLQDPRYKNRELHIMRTLSHQNCVQLLDSFYDKKGNELYLNLVLAFVPKNLYEVCGSFSKKKQAMPLLHVRLYIYQLMRSLSYIHSIGVCHRDIKPQNLLINPTTHELKLCDFGSAKVLVAGESNVSYICSRYYRAPELLFGAIQYTGAIDVWSSGCVLAELLLGQPLFAGDSAIDQLVEIIKVLGTPSREDVFEMNPDYDEAESNNFPLIMASPWTTIFPNAPAPLIHLLSQMLLYRPNDRVVPLVACSHPFFDELRSSDDPNLPPLFNFTESEREIATRLGILNALLPVTA